MRGAPVLEGQKPAPWNSGYTLVEILVAASIAGVILLVVGSVISQANSTLVRSFDFARIDTVRRDLIDTLWSSDAWENTIQAPINLPAKMDCLANGTPCTVDGQADSAPIQDQNFALFSKNGTLDYDAITPGKA